MIFSSLPRTGSKLAALPTRRIFALTAALLAWVPALGLAHAVVFPKASTPGAYERYVLRVPNERKVATTRVEIRFPGDVKVTSFADVPGWQLEVLRDSATRIIGAVWTGTLAPERFIEFPFVAVNPKNAAQIRWPAFQTYGDGERVEWTGDEGTKAPASVTKISDASASAAFPSGNTPLLLAGVALLTAFASLGLAMRKR